jgi:hypothetical protein
MRIDGGNVGIGTTSPSKKLDVFNSGTTTTDFVVRNGTVSLLSFVDSGGGYTGTSTNHPLLFTTNNTERMRITANGAVSFGASGTAYGTAGQVLISNGDAAPTWSSSAPASGFSNMVVFSTAGTSTWSVPAGVTKVKVTVVGGGGGGNTGGGGGGGGSAIQVITGLTPTSSISYTVGAAGSAGNGAAGSGGAGGTSSFGPANSITLTATGGSGAVAGAGGAGAGGVGSGGTAGFSLLIGGSAGQAQGGSSAAINGYAGGSSIFGGGGGGSGGSAGRAYGGGGSSTSSVGNAGASGVIVIEY